MRTTTVEAAMAAVASGPVLAGVGLPPGAAARAQPADNAPADDDLSAMSWVQAELRRCLEAAHKSLRRYLREAESLGGSDLDTADPAPLAAARQQLHQGVGALEMLNQPALAQVLRASEAAVQRIAARPALLNADALQTIESNSFALLDGLARLLAGKPVSPVQLFPQYRATQQLAGADRIHPADLSPLPWQWRELPADRSAQPRAADERARREMEAMVLALMRAADGTAPATTAARMSDLCADLAAGAQSQDQPRLSTLWQLAAAMFEAQAGGLLRDDLYVKRIASRLLAQLRMAVKGQLDLSDRLAQDLLFFCHHAGGPNPQHPAPRLAAVRATWPLPPGTAVAADYETPSLGRFDPALLAQARKRLAGAKDAWSAVAGGELHRLASLSEGFALVEESVRRIFPHGNELGQALAQAAQRTEAAESEPAPTLAMEVATALLYLDACLEDAEFDHPELPQRVQRLAERVAQVGAGAEPAPLETWMEELYRRVSDRQTMGSVVQELRAALTETEKQIDQFFRAPQDNQPLVAVPQQLAAMRGVLSVLGISQASQALLHMRDDIEALIRQPAGTPPRPGETERLADNLGALSFLIDMLGVQPHLAKQLFAFDAAAGRLRAVMRQAAPAGLHGPVTNGAANEPSPIPVDADASAAQPALATVDRAHTGSPAETAHLPTLQEGLGAAPEDRPTQAAPPVPEAEAPGAGVAAGAIEVAAAALAESASSAGPADSPAGRPAADAAQTPLLEQVQVLARALAGGPDAPPDDDSLLQRLDRLAQLALAADEGELARALGAARVALRSAADASTRGALRQDLAQGLLALRPAGHAAGLPAPEPSPVPASPDDEDAEMLEIFLEEAQEVIAGAHEALQRLAAQPADAADMTQLRRAFHTLKGSGRMVGLVDFGEAAWASEQLFNARLARQPVHMEASLHRFTAYALGRLDHWVQALAARAVAHEKPDDIIALAQALRLDQPVTWPDAAPAVPAAAPLEQALAPPFEAALETVDTDALALPSIMPDGADAVPAGRAPDSEASAAEDLETWFAGPAGVWATPPELPSASEFQPFDLPIVPDAEPHRVYAEASPEVLSPAAAVWPAAPVFGGAGDLASRVPGLPSAADLDLGLAPSAPSAPAAATPAAAAAAAEWPVPTPGGRSQSLPFEFDLENLGTSQAGAAEADSLLMTGELSNADALAEAERMPLAGTVEIPAEGLSPLQPADGAERIELNLAELDIVPPADEPLPDLAPILIAADAPAEPAAGPVPTDQRTADPMADVLAMAGLQALGNLAAPDREALVPLHLDLDEPPAAVQAQAPADAAGVASNAMLAAVPAPGAEPAAQPGPEALAEPPSALVPEVPVGGEEAVKVIGPLRIGIPLFNIYLNEADELSRRLGIELAEWSLDGAQQPVADSTIALAHSLAGSSATVGYADLSALARALEHALMRSQALGLAREGETQLFIDTADEIRRLLHQFAAGFLRDVPADLLQRLADHERWPATDQGARAAVEHADPLAQAAPAGRPEPTAPAEPAASDDSNGSDESEALPGLPAAPVAPAAPAVEDQIDPELFPIFAEEAEELLPSLQGRLREWLEQPAHADASSACMRTLHTFKGGARLAGAMRLGDAAHQLETEIERLVARDALHARDIEPLLAMADQMSEAFARLHDGAPTLAAGPAMQPASLPSEWQPPAPVADTGAVAAVETSVDAPAGASADGSAAACADAAAAAVPPSPVQHPETPAEAVPPAEAVAPSKTQVPPPRTGTQPQPAAVAIDWSRFNQAQPAASSAPPQPADLLERSGAAPGATGAVRVRAGLLDRLVNQAGEVSITRARIDADVRSLHGSLMELSESLERMRRQLRDIELQAETQISSRMEQAKASSQAFDPLEMDRFTRFQELTRFMAESVNDVATLQRSLARTLQSTEDELAAQARLTRELQDDLLRTRMVEFESMADRLYRTVRQAAKETGKTARLEIAGGAIEIDRGVLERMTGPFEHLLRNGVVHGIESAAQRAAAGKPAEGKLAIQVTQAGNEVTVEFSDDGAGLDLPRIRERAIERGLLAADAQPGDDELAQLIFAPGFSTATTVTELAGRGVGMDVVRAEVNAMGGRIEIASSAGQGTRMRLLLPLTTAVTQVVMLRCGVMSVAVPSTLIEVVRRVPLADIEASYDSGQFEFDNQAVPFFWLPALLQARRAGEVRSRGQTVVIVRSASQRVALHVDEVVGNQEVVVKNVGPQLARLPGLAGVTLLPSGVVSLIYNPVALAAVYAEGARDRMQRQPLAGTAGAAGSAALGLPGEPAMPETAPRRAPLVLVVDDSLTVRRVTQRLLVREGYRVTLAKDGMEALEKLAEERPAVLLSDIEMPRMDGFDLLRNVRADKALAGLPVVMITSRIAQKHRDYAQELGVDHYLGKPYSEDLLLSLVARYAAAAAVPGIPPEGGARDAELT